MNVQHSLSGKKFLVTCGPTWVKVDDVRVISNCSSGQLGHLIAIELTKAGGKVTLLEGPVAKRLEFPGIRVIPFQFFEELESLIGSQGSNPYRAIIHAAAVSDYYLRTPPKTKISSSKKSLTLKLQPTPKLIKNFKKLNSDCFLVGFKLESNLQTNDFSKISEKLRKQADCDLIVANTISPAGKYNGYILDPKGLQLDHATSRSAMAKRITRYLKAHL